MIKRILKISSEPYHVSVRLEQLILRGGPSVRIITITDKQFERMRIFLGKRRKAPESAAKQLEFF